MIISEASRRICATRAQQAAKPGRQIITFLLFANITLWVLDTFMSNRDITQAVQTEFYGLLAWGIISRISLPLLIFYRFHSCVVLVEIWKNTYRTKEPLWNNGPVSSHRFLWLLTSFRKLFYYLKGRQTYYNNSSILSYFYSASCEDDDGSSDCSSGYSSVSQQPENSVVYHELSDNSSPPSIPIPPPPPLPKRNSVILPSQESEHILRYNPNSPQLKINIPHGSSAATLDSRVFSSSKAKGSFRRTSLPLDTSIHELQFIGQTPHSESESLVLESTAYVQYINARRHATHATLLRTHTTNPGDRLRKMLSNRIEQRFIKVISSRKSRNNTKKRKHKNKKGPTFKSRPSFTPNAKRKFQRYVRSPGLIKNFGKRMFRKNPKSPMESYILDNNDDYYEEDILPSDHDLVSRSPTPRFIVDRQGTFRWPPINVKLEEDGNVREPTKTAIQPVLEQSEDPSTNLGIENFTLRTPSTENSSDSPSVLGWLQVKPDSHIFTPAIAQQESNTTTNSQEKGPFRKAPFHANMHVLKTKIWT